MPSDVVSLFKPGDKGPAAQVRQGVVEAWNTSTGNNTIRVAGGELLNVPALTGESASLKAGDVVALLSAGNRWFLLGKVTTPGDPGTVPTWTADITALTGQVDTIQTVTIPAVQNDVTIVQGDVIELNTVTVPAVQAVADAAQSTATGAAADAAAAQAAADAAQADADSLQTDLDAAEASITTLTGTTIPGLAADIAAAQADVDAILPITTTDISDDAITTPKIAAGQITAVKIAADTITASQIAANAITASELAANAVTAGKIAAGTIVAADIAANTITAAKIAAGTITATEIQAGAITATQLSATAIDGKTITGALFRTASSGQRIEISPSFSLTAIRGFTGHVSETSPGSLTFSSNTGLGSSVVSPNFGAGEARVDVSGNGGVGSTPSVTISANAGNNFSLSTSGARIGTDVIATLAASQALTNKDLSSPTNTFPTNPQPVTSSSGTLVTATTASFVAGSPVVGVTFVAPPSGQVYVTVSAHIEANNAGGFGYCAWEMRTGATIGSGTVTHTANTNEGVAAGGANGLIRGSGSNETLVTGLTPGDTYNVRAMHLCTPVTGGQTADFFYRAILVKPVL